jgi:hypothetical protein
MTLGEILLVILFVVIVGGVLGGFFYLMRVEEKLEKEAKPISPERDISDIDYYEPYKEKKNVEVVDMFCKSSLVGTKEPKSIQSFVIRFEDEYGKQFDLLVIEDYYQAIDVGQKGVLTTVDGDFYSFEVD